METWSIRQAATMEDFEACRSVASRIWGETSGCSAPQMKVHGRYGGVVLLAQARNEIIGFTLSFPARYRNQWVLWSHETGIVDEWVHGGIGVALKQKQRELARALGYEAIVWTFDPLISRNAHFNLNKLGATVVEHIPNCYGMMDDDPLNQGVESDRFVAYWKTGGSRERPASGFTGGGESAEQHRKQGKSSRAEPDRMPTGWVALACAEDQTPTLAGRESEFGADRIWTEIPGDFGLLKRRRPELGPLWVRTLRSVVFELEREGYRVQDFTYDRDRQIGRYEWGKPGENRGV